MKPGKYLAEKAPGCREHSYQDKQNDNKKDEDIEREDITPPQEGRKRNY